MTLFFQDQKANTFLLYGKGNLSMILTIYLTSESNCRAFRLVLRQLLKYCWMVIFIDFFDLQIEGPAKSMHYIIGNMLLISYIFFEVLQNTGRY